MKRKLLSFPYLNFVPVVKVTNPQMRLVALILVFNGQGSFWEQLEIRFQTNTNKCAAIRKGQVLDRGALIAMQSALVMVLI